MPNIYVGIVYSRNIFELDTPKYSIYFPIVQLQIDILQCTCCRVTFFSPRFYMLCFVCNFVYFLIFLIFFTVPLCVLWYQYSGNLHFPYTIYIYLFMLQYNTDIEVTIKKMLRKKNV